MTVQSPNDTIAAIATATGEAGIGIVRISGPDAIAVAAKIFVPKSSKANVSDFKTYTVHYGWIKDPAGANGASGPNVPTSPLVDEVLLTVMRAPKTYTREDVVEISCHGGIVPLRKTLDLCLSCGCRPAQPGEFTKRAFLNGRIDLSQAEAVLDIIRAKSDAALAMGVAQLKGSLSQEVSTIRDELLSLAAEMEARIDFPEEDLTEIDDAALKNKFTAVDRKLTGLLEGAERGRILREGIHCVICGRPNVGKSSLLNALLRKDRSIVTAIAGTTRDTVEEIIDIKGIPVRIVDTAGILEPRDLVERKAVQRSKEHIKMADLVLFVVDASKPLSKADLALFKKLKGKQVLAVLNKIDLPQRLDIAKCAHLFKHTVSISAKKATHINDLEESITRLVYSGTVQTLSSGLMANTRHLHLLKRAQKLVAQARHSLDNNLSLEFVSQECKEALEFIDELLGTRFSEDLLDRIFTGFCIGK